MTRIVTVIMLPILVAQASVTNGASFDQLVDRMITSPRHYAEQDETSPTLHADLDGATQGKTAALHGSGRSALRISPSAVGHQPQFRMNAMPRMQSNMQPTSALTGASCQSQVQHVQDTLKKYGIPSNPFLEPAVTSIAEANGICTPPRAGRVHPSMVTRATTLKKGMNPNIADFPGINEPLGFWDPLGFSAKADNVTLFAYREYELKHGRIGMLAALGIVVGETFSPLLGGPDLPAVMVNKMTTTNWFWPLVFAETALRETLYLYRNRNGKWDFRIPETPGDYEWDPLNLAPKDPVKFRKMQDFELNNGRLGMLAAAGMIAQEQVTNQKLFAGSILEATLKTVENVEKWPSQVR